MARAKDDGWVSSDEQRRVILAERRGDDLDGVWEVLVGKVPDPRGAVAEHDAVLGLVEAAPMCLALDTLGELRGGLVRVTCGVWRRSRWRPNRRPTPRLVLVCPRRHGPLLSRP